MLLIILQSNYYIFIHDLMIFCHRNHQEKLLIIHLSLTFYIYKNYKGWP